MIIITVRDMIRRTPKRWEQQYLHLPAQFYGHQKAKIASLMALDVETCSAEDINAIIGNSGWTSLQCDECQQEQEAVMRLGIDTIEADHDDRWQDLCAECLSKAAAKLGENE